MKANQMTVILAACCAFAAVCQPGEAKDDVMVVIVNSASAAPGRTAPVALDLNTNATEPSATVFTLTYDSDQLRFVSLEEGPVVPAAGKRTSYRVEPDWIRVVVSDPYRQSQPMESGTLATITFRVGGWVTPGTVLPIEVIDFTAADPEGNPIEVGATPGDITVTDGGEGEGEGEGERYHNADTDENQQITATEIGRLVGFYNAGMYQVYPGTADGYAPNEGFHEGPPHDSDYDPFDWQISAVELSRLVTFYNAGGYRADPTTQDGFAPEL